MVVFDSPIGQISLDTKFEDSATLIGAIFNPAAVQGTGSIFVLDKANGLVSNTRAYTIRRVAPVIAWLKPGSISVGTPDFSLAATVDRLGPDPILKWNGTPLAITSNVAGTVTALVPAPLVAAAGTAAITIESEGLVSPPAAFPIIHGPLIQTVSPDGVDAGGPDLAIVVTGSGYVSGSRVYAAGQPLATTFRSSTQLSAILPSESMLLAAGKEISVGNPDGSMAESQQVWVSVRPALTSVSPSSVEAGTPDVTLTIKGRGFRPTGIVQFSR
ncbi:IPT/TIG domain-containing protein [uncultured Paludibaculum sp.]|uniref:IPT/TIG domain-containing protein n=1 Tax=uncultured Paludibaculum sp. TaxID=1765020 RepID=UPI002AABFCC9|nr:IPT/TIG domain-containing protein [uncultured Paludibaculum sp.]